MTDRLQEGINLINEFLRMEIPSQEEVETLVRVIKGLSAARIIEKKIKYD